MGSYRRHGLFVEIWPKENLARASTVRDWNLYAHSFQGESYIGFQGWLLRNFFFNVSIIFLHSSAVTVERGVLKVDYNVHDCLIQCYSREQELWIVLITISFGMCEV